MKPLFIPFHFSPLPHAFVLAAIMATSPVAAHADMWEKIIGNSGRTVEIDTSAIINAEHGSKVSWGQFVLDDSEAKINGYRTIKALNRYDCLGRSFTTVKRVYMDDDNNILREESMPTQQPIVVRSNSIDEQIWRKVCGLSTASATGKRGNRSKAPQNSANRIRKVASAADRAAQKALQPAQAPSQAASPPPKAMLLPVSATAVNTRSQKNSVTLAAADSPPADLHIQLKPIPMPSVPPKPPAPKLPEQPVSPQSQKRLPEPSPPPQRGSAKQPLVLPAPAVPPRGRESVPAQQPVLFPENSESWSYSGATGPEFWGKLRPEWTQCTEGKRQSPIEFMTAKPVLVNLDPIQFDYRPTSFVIINGHRQLRIRVTEGMSMEVRGQRYTLEGFTLHRPAETRINNKAADIEAHFFHRDDKGRIALLAVQFVRGSQPSAPLQTLLNNLPLERGDSYAPQTTLNMAAFLPSSTAHYLYMGSLTTPPCTEGVLWVVMKEPMTLSDGQYEVFSRLHPENARPPQPAFDRLILESQ